MFEFKSNVLSLYSSIDDIFNKFSKELEVGHYSFTPYFSHTIWDEIEIPKFECSVSYPVFNCYITEDGTCVLEIACTGFSKDELSINRENNIVTVEGKKKEGVGENEAKYLFRKLAKRDFQVSYELSNKLDFDSIKIKLENGLLEIKVPLKENEKPIKKELKIE